MCFGVLLSGISGFGEGVFVFAGRGLASTSAGAKAVVGIEGLIGVNSLVLSVRLLK